MVLPWQCDGVAMTMWWCCHVNSRPEMFASSFNICICNWCIKNCRYCYFHFCNLNMHWVVQSVGLMGNLLAVSGQSQTAVCSCMLSTAPMLLCSTFVTFYVIARGVIFVNCDELINQWTCLSCTVKLAQRVSWFTAKLQYVRRSERITCHLSVSFLIKLHKFSVLFPNKKNILMKPFTIPLMGSRL